LAILLPAGKAAVYTLFLARFVSGLGAANVTLAYSYTATAIPHDQQTTTNILLSMVKIVGMSLGPFVNLSLSRIDTQIRFWNLLVPLNAYNSVGLMVAAGQLVVLFVTLVFLKEPPEKQNSPSGPAKKAGMKEFWEAFTCFQIMLPLVIVFVVNCNFQL
jgi:MFS family permease